MKDESKEHIVLYDHKRGLWVCRDEGCDWQMLPAKLDQLFGRTVSIESGHSMWVGK